MKNLHRIPLGAAALLAFSVPASAVEIEFNRDIRPIFSKHCTGCHGGVKSAGGLSFVYREKAISKGKSGEVAIVPGKPLDSELVRRITSEDKEEIMPRPDHGPRLSDGDIAKLKTWIEQGAHWSEHWAFVPPKEAVPSLKQTDWPKSRMDAWILAKLESEGLAPSPAAAPQEWLRRVSLDLIGLPPSLEEFDAFSVEFQTQPETAKSRAVDRLMASPHFGERWASMWLDLARYADTFGFEKDPHRDIWPWRDWVIRALNSDMPFDQFTIKQLAGDLLPNPTGDDLLATAFHRNTQNNTEGGTDDEEYRVLAVLDRVNTTWTAWQATTFGCTQCHSHPYDPFPHRDYYRFVSFFNNTQDNDLDDDFPRLNFPEQPDKRDEVARLFQERESLRSSLNTGGANLAQTMAWEKWTPTSAVTTGGDLVLSKNGRVDANGTLPVGVKYTLTFAAREAVSALKFEIFPESEDPQKWPERGSVLSELKLTVIRPDGRKEDVKLREVVADYLAGPYDPQSTLNKDKGGFGGYPVLTGPRWCVVVLETPLQNLADATLELVMAQSASTSGAQSTAARHFQWSTVADTRWQDLLNSPERKVGWAKITELDATTTKLGGPKVPVMNQRPASGSRANRMFVRGNRLTPGESVDPGIPEVSRPPEKKDGLTRLDMARWLVGDQNTLTSRVLVNRLWAELFGHGIVETLEDFGTSGATPSHPELLDHLALRMRKENGWSLKSFLREVALSATYGQTNRASKTLVEKDPRNLLLARGPRNRLTAEMVRDQALTVSGLLAPKLFGAPVYPPQPEGIWSSVYNGKKWETSTGPDRYRRAIYTYLKRTSGYPGFLTFDAPTRDACTARRIPTNTPLQALLTLNDPACIELAQTLAARMSSVEGALSEQIGLGCRLITLAPPPPSMVETLVKLFDRAIAEPDATPDKAMLLVANTILNMDAALNR